MASFPTVIKEEHQFHIDGVGTYNVTYEVHMRAIGMTVEFDIKNLLVNGMPIDTDENRQKILNLIKTNPVQK